MQNKYLDQMFDLYCEVSVPRARAACACSHAAKVLVASNQKTCSTERGDE